MKAYRAIISSRFRVLLQYRAAAAAGFATQLFWGLLRIMIFAAFYRSTTGTQPMNFAQIVTYVWLGQALLAMQPWSIDTDVRQAIRTGTVAYELLRPLDLYNLWFARSLALRSAPTLLRAVPMLILAWFFFGLQAPPSGASACAFAVSIVLALLLSTAISTILLSFLLWTVSGDGIHRITFAGVYALSGMIVPIPLYPDWAQAAVSVLPFRGLVDTPFRIYCGSIPPDQAAGAIIHQIVWTAAIVMLGRWVLAKHVRTMVVQGG